MNAMQNKDPSPTVTLSGDEVVGADSALSAWIDGELREAELDGLMGPETLSAAMASRGQMYQLIGESLRGQLPVLPAKSPAQFLASLQQQLDQEPRVATLGPARALPTPAAVARVRAPAANDSVFRWKLLAGAASLAAVMAVSWTVLGTVPGGPGSASIPQLALMGPAPQASSAAVAARAPARAEPVAVNTSQGVLIRDAQLEALMAEHRQFGGVSALQMPAGFLRNATYDSNGR